MCVCVFFFCVLIISAIVINLRMFCTADNFSKVPELQVCQDNASVIRKPVSSIQKDTISN